MKTAFPALFLFFALLAVARADVTIAQKLEGAGPVSEMTIKIKGDRARIDATPQISTIVDSKTGETVTLMHDQKMVVRVSPEKMKAAMEMIGKFKGETKGTPEPPAKLTPTGKKETINGFETDEYVCETSSFRATYWIAMKFPDAATILKQLHSLNADAWKIGGGQIPDYHDFPGLPIKTEIVTDGKKIVSTIVSVKQDPLSDADFGAPTDYQEMKTPDLGGILGRMNKPDGKSEKP